MCGKCFQASKQNCKVLGLTNGGIEGEEAGVAGEE